MAIVKLANAGESATWTIKSAEITAGKFGQQVKFESTTGDVLYISAETAQRQLSRIPLDVENCTGETLTFSRDENPKGGAPYWSIRLAGAGSKQAAPQAGRIQSPYAAPSKPPYPFDAPLPDEEYGASVADPYSGDTHPPRQANMAPMTAPVVKQTPKAEVVGDKTHAKVALANSYIDLLRYIKANSGLTDEQAIQAAAATLFIAYDKAGLR